MPVLPPARWSLPDSPDLAWLRRRAKRLRSAAADPTAAEHVQALALVETHDPAPPGTPVTLARAQRALARAFGFAGWARLVRHLEVVTDLARSPDPDGPTRGPADDLLRLVLLSYARHDHADLERGAALLRAHPGLATTDPHTLAACGRADDLAAALREDPTAVSRDGGPYRWPPLLHAAYSRLSLVAPDLAGDPVATVRVLLDAGADPDAGFLWRGLAPPFTALTGVLGGGERDEPAHPDAVALAGLLLDAGADPHDDQALYNRMFRPDDSHLPPLLAHGLARPGPSAWRDRLGDALPPPAQAVGDHLCFAAHDGYTARVRLLLEHGVDPSLPGGHPVLHGRTPHQLAVRAGHREIAELLVAAGARPEGPGAVASYDALVGAVLAGDVAGVARLVDDAPGVVADAVRLRPDALAVAAQRDDARALAAVGVLVELGWPVDARGADGRTALHEAALRGDVALCGWLLARGADATTVDRDFSGTPAGWAHHGGHEELAVELDAAAGARAGGGA